MIEKAVKIKPLKMKAVWISGKNSGICMFVCTESGNIHSSLKIKDTITGLEP